MALRAILLAACVFALGWSAAAACAGDAAVPRIVHRLHPVDPHQRAGHPEIVARYAIPTETPSYCFGYIGGGAAFGLGEPRALHEGTWGRDYCGHLFSRRVWLNWWHGLHYQGGYGAYATDGPKLR